VSPGGEVAFAQRPLLILLVICRTLAFAHRATGNSCGAALGFAVRATGNSLLIFTFAFDFILTLAFFYYQILE
jgi:hypothetical protein